MLDSRTSSPLDGDIGAGFDEYLFYLLTQVNNRRGRDFSPALEALGLSIGEWRALSVINRLGGCLMSELSEFTTVDRTTLTRTVDQLVANDIVARSDLQHDRRQVMVMLTPKGRECFEKSIDVLRAHNARLLDGLSDQDQQTLRALLQRILKNIVTDPDHFERVLTFQR